MRRVDNNSK